ncbi:MAG: hypothetical protein HYX51_05545 [Chloroflexi bacterium]|nr:hypothetical protein [Chloroflexota bacterium]
MPFVLGWEYTRNEIPAEVGGGTGDYLPHKDGVVVAGCFRTDTNPDAPHIILPGDGPEVRRWADHLTTQPAPIPVFITIGPNRWRYEGRLRVASRSFETDAIAGHARKSGRRDVTQALFLESVDNAQG